MDAKLFEDIFYRWGINPVETEPKDSKAANDFNREIQELLLPKEIVNRRLSPLKSQMAKKNIWEGITFLHTPRNLKGIAEKLGFAIQESSSFYYVRDSFLRLFDNSIRLPRKSQFTEIAMERTHSSNLYMDKTSMTRTRNQLFNHWSGFSGQYRAQSEADAEKFFSGHWQAFDYAYVEGGNVYALTNSQGEISLILGEDHLTQTLQILELEEQDWELLAVKSGMAPISKLIEEIAVGLSLQEIRHFNEEMYSLGMWSDQGETGIIPQEGQLNILLTKFFIPGAGVWTITEEEQGWFRALAEQSGFVKKLDLTDIDLEGMRSIVAGYLAKRKVVKGLIALDFHVKIENVHFITQANYHLDEFLLPAPGQALFLQSYALCVEVLEKLIEARFQLAISDNDLLLLEGYLEAAKKFDKEMGSLLKIVEAQLKQAGFTVIPVPAHFLYEPKEMYSQFPMPSEGICINFINALTGWSSKIHGSYYITHGFNVGEQVGKLCMKAFSLVLERCVPGISTFFVGYDPENPEDYSEALDFWNRLETQSGVHCTTFPLF